MEIQFEFSSESVAGPTDVYAWEIRTCQLMRGPLGQWIGASFESSCEFDLTRLAEVNQTVLAISFLVSLLRFCENGCRHIWR